MLLLYFSKDMSSLAELADRHKNAKLTGKKTPTFKLGKAKTSSSGLSLKDLLNQKPKLQLPSNPNQKISINVKSLLSTAANEPCIETNNKADGIKQKLKCLHITPPVTRYAKKKPSTLFLALSWKPKTNRLKRQLNSKLDFTSQYDRFDNQNRKIWKHQILSEYEETQYLFHFNTLSPDGVVLEAQKKAFTRCEK